MSFISYLFLGIALFTGLITCDYIRTKEKEYLITMAALFIALTECAVIMNNGEYQIHLLISIIAYVVGALWSLFVYKKNKKQASIISSYSFIFATVFTLIGIILLILTEYGLVEALYTLTK